MNEIPCELNAGFRTQYEEFAELLKTRLPEFLDMTEEEIYQSGLFRAAIERIRGQFSASMGEKRAFVARILNHLQDLGLITNWESSGGRFRHDYTINMPSGRVSVIELKGCLDGNNTTIFERPNHANEFMIWSVCSNPGADPRHNVWSGIHTRLSADIIARNVRVDGLIVWDWICGTLSRPCPKLLREVGRRTTVGAFQLTPPCIYVFPQTVPNPRANPRPTAQALGDVEFLQVLHTAFRGLDDEVNYVDFEVGYDGAETVRRTTIRRGGVTERSSELTPIQRV